MCEISPAISNLLSGLAGSVIGVGATVWATGRAISASAEQLEIQRGLSDVAEYKQRLSALSAEVGFNLSLPQLGENKKIPVFIHAAWTNFLTHAHQLEAGTIEDLTKAYGFAIYHNSAAQLEDVGKENFGGQIEKSFDQALINFKSAKEKIDAVMARAA